MNGMQWSALVLVGLLPLRIWAQAAPSTEDDRIALSANGGTIASSHGVGGASAAWLHNFDADTLAGAAVEHDIVYNTNWTFGSLNGSLTRPLGGARYSVYGEVHEGAGNSRQDHFRYEVEAAGVIGTYFNKLSLQLEDKRIDILNSHGNLPKFGVTYLWNAHLGTTVSYSHDISGNLGTRQTAARADFYGPVMNFAVGGAYGQASPSVLNLPGLPNLPGSILREGYVGLIKPFPQWRGELSVVADFIDLSGTKRDTLTVGYIFHFGHR